MLTADKLHDIFQVDFSPIGSNARNAEELAMIYFVDFLHEVEGENASIIVIISIHVIFVFRLLWVHGYTCRRRGNGQCNTW